MTAVSGNTDVSRRVIQDVYNTLHCAPRPTPPPADPSQALHFPLGQTNWYECLSRTATAGETLCSILHDYTNRHLGFIGPLWVRGFLNRFHKSPILQSSLYLSASVPSSFHLLVISFVSLRPSPVPAILLRSHSTDGSFSQDSPAVQPVATLTHFAQTRYL